MSRSHTRQRQLAKKSAIRLRWKKWQRRCRQARKRGWPLPSPPQREAYGRGWVR